MKRTNVEIKARCPDPEGIRERLLARQARFAGLDHQIDTYFPVPHGRLKLRQGNIENALIHYARPDQAGPKRSDVLLYQAVNGHQLLEVLSSALGVWVVVDKKRSIFFIENVKFHLDEVRGLGAFVEIEAIDENGSLGEEYLRRQCAFYLDYLGIDATHLLEASYSDMILQHDSQPGEAD